MTISTAVLLFVTGAFAGSFGAIIGSSLFLLVPVLIHLGLAAPIALGTAKVSTLFRDIPALWEFHQNKKVDYSAGLLFTAAGIVGTLAGSFYALSLDPERLEQLISLITIGAGLLLLARKDAGMNPTTPSFSKRTRTAVALAIGLAAGLYAGVFGGGVNLIIIFALMFLEGHDFLTAVATSKLPNILFMLVFIAVFAAHGQIDYITMLPLAAGGAVGGHYGAKLAILKGNRFVKNLFILATILLAAKLLFDLR